MSEKESRHITDKDVAQAYLVTVEQVVMDLMQESCAMGSDGETPEDVKKNLIKLGCHIQRHVIEPYREMVSLTKGDEITHVAQIWREDDEIKYVILTAEEIAAPKKEEFQ